MQDHKKALNSLMSSSTTVVKKRQVMRLSLGDYREKMLKDEQKNVKGKNEFSVFNTMFYLFLFQE